ncbi:hypothetical protein RDP63_003002, partial [Enterococcus faecalis]|nr:hypothetical protein [Enterococcus faecalis]
NREGTLDPFSNETLLHKVDLAFDDNQTFKIDEKVVTYNYLVYQYEYIRKNEITNPIREKRVGLYVADIIIFNYNFKNYYIVDKGYTTPTLGNLRTLAGYSGKMEISEQRIIGIKTDLFIWMIHHLLDNPNSFLNDQNNTKVESVIGFKGSTADKLAEISGSGEKIMKMLTTLLFLFENQKISKVETTVFRKDERFKLTLGEKSLVEIDFNSFEGEDFFVGKEELKSKVAIKVFVDVIPNLISIFSDEIDSKKWSMRKEEKFFKDIGRDLSRKINEKLRTKNK